MGTTESLSTILTTAIALAMVAPTGFDSRSVKVSSASPTASSMMPTGTVFVVSPGANVRVPLAAV